MASRKSAVKLTANFESSLASIERFWIDADSPQSYDRLLDVLLETVIPNLERFPKMDRLFLSRKARSVESQAVIEIECPDGPRRIREYLMNDCLILYASIGDAIYLLSISINNTCPSTWRHSGQNEIGDRGYWK